MNDGMDGQIGTGGVSSATMASSTIPWWLIFVLLIIFAICMLALFVLPIRWPCWKQSESDSIRAANNQQQTNIILATLTRSSINPGDVGFGTLFR
jgi:hypothetical protein